MYLKIFNGFRDKSGNFKAYVGEDYKGILYLYMKPHSIQWKVKAYWMLQAFATKHLKEYIKVNQGKDMYLSTLVSHALELPLR
ncbi:hypothetical protein SLE2022_305760 [Rubroshorea leprosula]